MTTRRSLGAQETGQELGLIPSSKPQTSRKDAGSQEVGVYANPGFVDVKTQPQSVALPAREGPFQHVRENNVAFLIFLAFTIPLFIYLLLLMIPAITLQLNRYLFGIFKRPLPDHPELYYDANCVNSMNLSDLLQPDQVQRCAAARPINRLGPPRFR